MKTHNCGGTILWRIGGAIGEAHAYCDRCWAFKYDDVDDLFPTGTDREKNQEAWNSGEGRSPDFEADAKQPHTT